MASPARLERIVVVSEITKVTNLPFSTDAATVYGLAATALPFAQSNDEEAERWLRVLRLNGDAGAVLQSLAIGEAPLTTQKLEPAGETAPADETLTKVAAIASEHASRRGASAVSTVDLLVAVMQHYPDAFERALNCRGSDCAELVEKLATKLHLTLR